MKTLQISDGDLVIGPNGYGLVSGVPKVSQDIRMAIGEPLGNDRFHPGWGSRMTSYIGGFADAGTRFSVEQEAGRVVSNYAAIQHDFIQRDALRGNKSRFTTDEVIATVEAIIVRLLSDTISIDIHLRTLAKSVLLSTTVGV